MNWIHQWKMGGAEGIATLGPIIVCRLTVSRAKVEFMRHQGEEPPRQDVRLMIDTGACSSAINASFLHLVGARYLRQAPFISVNHQQFSARVYSASVEVWGEDPNGQRTLRSFDVDFAGMGEPSSKRHTDGVLGRDFLHSKHFAYDGVSGTFGVHVGAP